MFVTTYILPVYSHHYLQSGCRVADGNAMVVTQEETLKVVGTVFAAEDNLTLSGMVPHTGAICPTELSTVALANCKLTLNTAWLVMHSLYVFLHISAMKRNF